MTQFVPAKSLETKLARILADPACGDFILADAKDADMAFGVESAGRAPAVRMNDTTDIWLAAGTGSYSRQPALPFATSTIAQARFGSGSAPADAAVGGLYPGANLGLFSITLNDDAALDRDMLAAYREFRQEAERDGFRHFLEIFYPNAPGAVPVVARPQRIARNTSVEADLGDVFSRGFCLAGGTTDAMVVLASPSYAARGHFS